MTSSPWKWLALSVVVVSLDQITKIWVESRLLLYDRFPVIDGFFDIILVYNKGGAFSLLAEQGGWQRWFFTILVIAITLFLLAWLHNTKKTEYFTRLGLALVIGGAIGNLIDRLIYGHVIDFILIYYQDWAWPAFNIADSTIVLGVGFLMFAIIRKES